MVAKPVTSATKDFDDVIAFLSTVRVIDIAPSQDVLSIARRIHSMTYTLILWKFSLKKLSSYGSPFVEEIASDALQVLPQVLLGSSKTARLLMRGILENTLRHIYFSDHPVEFEIMNRESRWFMDVKALVEYAKSHPLFSVTEPQFAAIGKLYSIYSDLSAAVHGRRVIDLEMRKSLQHISLNKVTANKEADLIKQCAECCNFVLAVFHRARFRRFPSADRSAILRTMPKRAREIISDMED